MPYIPKKGDVITYPWPNDDPNALQKVKNRPCLVLKVISPDLILICITTKNKSHYLNGIWIDEKHHAFVPMRLREESFINLDDIKILPASLVRAKMGTCPLMDEIDKLLSK